MTWVAVAIGGAAVIGAGASYAGSKKQAGASKKAAQMNLDQFHTINSQQQPFVQSGYGAMSRLNTLLGLSPRSMSGGPQRPPQGQGMPDFGMTNNPMASQQFGMSGNTKLRQILALRAAHGDQEAARTLGTLQ